MVATYTSSQASLASQNTGNSVGASFYCTGSISLTTALTANDLILLTNIPNGYQVMDVVVDTDALDSGASAGLRLAVGDATTPTRFITSANTGAGGNVHMNVAAGLLYSYTVQTSAGNPGFTTILAKCTTAASTWVNGTMRLAIELQTGETNFT
jgi:hypothetical protein